MRSADYLFFVSIVCGVLSRIARLSRGIADLTCGIPHLVCRIGDGVILGTLVAGHLREGHNSNYQGHDQYSSNHPSRSAA